MRDHSCSSGLSQSLFLGFEYTFDLITNYFVMNKMQGGHFVFIDNPSGFHSAVFHACRKFLSSDNVDHQSLPEGLTSA